MGLASLTLRSSSRVLLGLGVFLVIVSLYFFSNSVFLVSAGDVAAGLLSALIGFALLATSTTMIKLWSLMKMKEEKGEVTSSSSS